MPERPAENYMSKSGRAGGVNSLAAHVMRATAYDRTRVIRFVFARQFDFFYLCTSTYILL